MSGSPTPTCSSTGDTVTIGRYPNIDFANGGNIKGMIAATDTYLKLVNDKTKIVPGHGPLADRAALIDYRAMLVTARDRMAKLVKEGKSEADVVAAKPFADLDAQMGADRISRQELHPRRLSLARRQAGEQATLAEANPAQALLHDLGFRIVATHGTAQALRKMGIPTEVLHKIGEGSPNVVDWIERGEVDLVVNTPIGTGARTDGYQIRTAAVARGIPCITTMSGGMAAARAILAARRGEPEVISLQEIHTHKLSEVG